MKVTNQMLKTYVKHQLATNTAWALKGLTTIYSRQTTDEKASGTTNNLNNIGFSGADAEILSSFAVQYQKWNSLSNKQMAILFKKIPRYAGQLITCIADDKLPKVESDALSYHQTQPVQPP